MDGMRIVITDADIDWIKNIMPDIEFDDCRINILKNMEARDIHACPGSGKTTLLVEKLAILANKWNEKNRGICVLSHTNVAREEIQERLGNLDVGKKLLSYPHFIGTFQSFMDTFIAMPFIRSCGNPVNIIDTDFVTERRWDRIYAKKWLINNKKDKKVCDPLALPCKFKITCGEESSTYKSLAKVVTDSRKRGEFTFNEMEMYTFYGLDKCPQIRDIFQQRFPIMFIDEAQDTKNEIWELINRLYNDAVEGIFYQAYGDGNQAIFNSYERMEELTFFPRADCLEMLNSKRFTNSIAQLSNGVALDKRKMTGEGIDFNNTNVMQTIFLFEPGEEKKVLEQYAQLILKSFSDEEIKANQRYGCHVLGMVHKLEDKEDEVAVRLSNYYPEYNPETKRTTPTHLIDYFYIGDEQLNKTQEYSQKVEWICKGILRLIRIAPKKEMEHSNSAFKTILKNVKNDEIRDELLIICNQKFFSEQQWHAILGQVYGVFAEFIDVDKIKEDKFVEWRECLEKAGDSSENNVINQMCYTDGQTGRSVDLKFGSIHSSKGRTHLSTLVVETKYHEYNLESILPWLSGKSGKLGKRNQQRLKCQYVAMTRAKGLLCLALKKDSISDKEKNDLISYGWNVENV